MVSTIIGWGVANDFPSWRWGSIRRLYTSKYILIIRWCLLYVSVWMTVDDYNSGIWTRFRIVHSTSCYCCCLHVLLPCKQGIFPGICRLGDSSICFGSCRAADLILKSFCVLLAKRLPTWKPREEPPERRLLKNKQCDKIVFGQNSNLQPLEYRSTALPLELQKTSTHKHNFGYLNPTTCLLYDFNNNSIVMFFDVCWPEF